MKRVLVVTSILGCLSLLAARPANPLSVGADFALHLYQKLISPLQGGHICNFSPTCSEFSRRSYRSYGPFWATLMTFDRLERCNVGAWSLVDRYYLEVENQRLVDYPCDHYLPDRLEKIDTLSEEQPVD